MQNSYGSDARSRITYSLPALVFGGVILLFTGFVPKFYADVVGADVALMGFFLLVARVLDGVTDPLVGYWSDRTHTRWGRRHPWIVASTPLTVVTVLAMVHPPVGLSAKGAAIWFGACSIAFTVFLTMQFIPWLALGAQLSSDRRERNRLFGVRSAGFFMGTILFSLTAVILDRLTPNHSETSERLRFHYFGLIFLVISVLLIGYFSLRLREPRMRDDQRPLEGLIAQWVSLLKNRPFLWMIALFVLTLSTQGVVMALYLFYVEHILQSSLGPALLFLNFLAALLTIPLWVGLAHRFGKRRTLMLGFGISTVANLLQVPLGPGQETAFVILTLLGFGLTYASCIITLLAALLSDVIDYDEWRVGTRREGAFFGVESFCNKAGTGIAVGLAFALLGWVGYEKGAEMTDSIRLTIRACFFGYPIAANILQIALLATFPLRERDHKRIAEELRKRSTPDSESGAPR